MRRRNLQPVVIGISQWRRASRLFARLPIPGSTNWISDLHRRQPPPEISLDDDLETNPSFQITAPAIEDPARVAVDIFERQQLRLALARLTNEQRQVITLKYLANLENEEIAQTLNKPVGAIKSLQFRALAALRRMLPEEDNGRILKGYK